MSLFSSIVNGIFANEASDERTDAAQSANDTALYIYDDIKRRNQFREGLGNAAAAQQAYEYGLIDNPQGGTFAQGLNSSFGGDNFYGGGTRGFSQSQMLPGGSGGQFDYQSYFAANPDVAAAYTPGAEGFTNPAEFAEAHWTTHGQNEGRDLGIPQNRLASVPGLIPGGENYATGAQDGAGGGGRFENFYNSPDYQLAFTEGLKGIENGAANRGGLLSGNTGKAAIEFSQNLAGNTYGNYRNALNNIAGQGQQASQTTTNAGQNYSAQFGANQSAIGAANANRYDQYAGIFNQGRNTAMNFITGGLG